MTTSQQKEALRTQIRAEMQKKRRVREGLNWHLAVFAVVNVLLFVINQMFSPGTQWFVFPLFGWGLGLFFHAFAVTRSGRGNDDLDAEVERELTRRGVH
jgi:uncharacterized membrane protein